MVLSTVPSRLYLTKTSDEILGAADRAETKLRRALDKAMRELKAATPDVEDMIVAGRIDDVLRAFGKIDLPPEVKAAIREATVSAAITAGAPEAARFGVAFNDVNAQAIRWAETHSAKLVTAMSLVEQSAIRTVITESVTAGVHPYKTARHLKDLVGLTPRHAASVNRLYFSALADGVTHDQARRVASRKAAKLLRYRTRNIARTESLRAANMGQQIVWDQAVSNGLLPATTRKIWMATSDDRTCKICAVMDGKTVAIDQTYRVDRQATGFTTSGGDIRVTGTVPLRRPHSTPTPPAHPSCRCTVVLQAG